MLSSAKIGTSSWRYYTNSAPCAATEYYLGVGEAPGYWHGRGLAALGLEPGAVGSEAQLEALFARALHPSTREQLGRAWRSDGVTGFDLTFSAPKSVSALWALGDSGTAWELRAAHKAAVAAALGYLDAHASASRRGVDGVEQVGSAGLVAACFDHRTSRCADPQLHTHALVLNKVQCADGVWRSLDATELFGHKKSAGMIYQAALRSEITSRLGLVFDTADTHGQAEIIGVPSGLLKLWSKRTAQITPEAAGKIAEYEQSLGRSLTSGERAAVTKTAVLKTRPGKTHQHPVALAEGWAAEAAAAGYHREDVVAGVQEAARQAVRQPPASGAAIAVAAIQAAAGLRSTFSRADVAGQVAARLPGDGRSAQEVVATVERLTDEALELDAAVSVGSHPRGVTARASDARWAGATVLAAEARVLSLAERGRGAGHGLVHPAVLITFLADTGLDADQHAAVRALAGDGDFVSVLTAPAGAGKTVTLGAAARLWRGEGYRVIGLAPSARAAAELASATGGTADTLAKWIHDHRRRGLLPGHERARTILDPSTVVILDEASMANTHDLDMLTTAAARAGAKVVLVGDPAQIGVVNGPGGMLSALAAAGHGVDLSHVHRFTHTWEREASLRLRRGDPEVLTTYQIAGRVHASLGSEAALDAVHEHWATALGQGRRVLMMARTRTDVDTLNALARATLQAAGEIGGPAVEFWERQWQAGDLLRTRRNNRHLPVGDGHVRNGDLYLVTAVAPEGLTVLERRGRGWAFLPGDYVAAHAEHGWAATIDSAQGATVDVGLVLVRPGVDREHLYVAMTRGREANHAYITGDTIDPIDRHGPTPRPYDDRTTTVEDRAIDILATALANSGAQDSAHTMRENARHRAAEQTGHAAEATAMMEAARARIIPAEHTARVAELTRLREQRAHLDGERDRHNRLAQLARTDLAETPRWRRGLRNELLTAITAHQSGADRTFAPAATLDRGITTLTRRVEDDTRQREQQRRTRTMRTEQGTTGEAYLAPAQPAGKAEHLDLHAMRRGSFAIHRDVSVRRRDRDLERIAEQNRRIHHDRDHSRGRDDGRAIGI
jgi:conjugative relaxase-like TrwC/TraI family protein